MMKLSALLRRPFVGGSIAAIFGGFVGYFAEENKVIANALDSSADFINDLSQMFRKSYEYSDQQFRYVTTDPADDVILGAAIGFFVAASSLYCVNKAEFACRRHTNSEEITSFDLENQSNRSRKKIQ